MILRTDQIVLPKPPRFQDIPQFTRSSSYSVTVSWGYLEKWINEIGIPVELDPDFQRAHVWTKKQQTRYIEYILRGGISSRDVYWNSKGWGRVSRKNYPIQLVDGKQRIQAVLEFLHNKVKAFGYFHRQYADRLPIMEAKFTFHVNDLETRAEVLQWYLDLNSGGVVHTEKELDRVRDLLEEDRLKNV